MSPHFGSKVTGHDAYEQAVRKEAGGGNVFGVRVIGANTGTGPTNDAKRNSEFGVAVIDGAHASDVEGKPGDTVSIEQLQNILAENPTFFDSLYEAELAREDGARPDALGIFYEVERGIKGQMRPDVMQEIRALMGQKGIDAEALANQAKVRVQAIKEMQQRTKENALLDDAARVQALVSRNENVKKVQEQQQKDGIGVQVGFTSEAQERRIADEQGLKLPGDEHANATGSVPTKPDGAVHQETQQPGKRILVPKSGQDTADSGSSTGGSRPVDGAESGGGAGAGSEEDESDDQSETGERDDQDFTEMKKADLEAYLGEEELGKLKEKGGSGANGSVLHDDLVKAAKRKQKRESKES